MFKRGFILLSFAMVCFAGQAESVDKVPFYFRADGGISLPRYSLNKDFYPDDDNVLFRSAFLGGGIGYNFNDYFRSDITTTVRWDKYDVSINAVGYTDNIHQSFRNIYTLVNWYYTPYKYKSLSPYISGGIGASWNKAGIYSGKAALDGSPPGLPNYRSSNSSTKLSFAWSVGLGLVTDVSDHLSLDVFYKYVDLGSSGKIHITQSVEGYPNEFYDIKPDVFRNHQIGIGLIWKL